MTILIKQFIHPCKIFDKYFEGYPVLEKDNEILRKEGIDAWAKLQNERNARGYTYSDEK